MRRIRIFNTAVLLLTVAGTAAHAQGDQGRGRGRGREEGPPPVTAEEQQRRIKDEQRRTADYQKHLDQQAAAAQKEAAQLQQQKRAAQYRAQQEYEQQLAQQRAQVRAERTYATDPYITAPHTYRYRRDGVYYETNQYGADVLRKAVNYGYQQGYRAGEADRQDHWKPNYANSPAYREATFGYTGNYVDLADYNYYFRQGFQRGYNDGYYSRLQYGSNSNGTYSILANVLSSILGFTTIH